MYDVIIVGGAAAGLTAALYTSRQNMKTLVLTKDIGGQTLLTPHIENYPGFEKIGGLELMEKFKAQAERFGAEFIYEEVKSIKKEENGFEVYTFDNRYEAVTLILAFGKTPRDLGVPGEEKFIGKGVSYCAVCDAPLFANKKVAIAGIGEPALDAALMLCSRASKVYLLYPSSRIIANESLANTCQRKENMEIILNAKVKEIRGSNKVEQVIFVDKEGEKSIDVDGIFIEMGYVAKTDFVKDLVALNDKGEIIVDKEQRTSKEGIFAAGDVTDTPYKQIVISAGDGAKAGLSAYNYLQRLRGKPIVKGDWKSILDDKDLVLNL
ncbi:MAG: thioredoxin reductase [Candidatus Nitrosocaldaceae archaeon]|nr:MAG: thioredoxin reductase [Candidatus Nitrosocaldaceae archaeon]